MMKLSSSIILCGRGSLIGSTIFSTRGFSFSTGVISCTFGLTGTGDTALTGGGEVPNFGELSRTAEEGLANPVKAVSVEIEIVSLT